MSSQRQHTLNIEVGVLCNNRCVFCYQKGYRGIPGFPKLVPGEEIRARMRWARANDYDEVSFTGGEPTVRPDFLELVAYARELGFRWIAITTNGWRLARPDFFAAAAEAGLTSIGVSIHGPTAEIHDAATGHDGSFVRAIQTVRNAMATRGTPRFVRLNTFTVVSRMNHHRLRDLADLLFALGVRLMVMQPAILSKSNVEEAGAVALELPDLVDAVRSVVLRGIERGFRTKLFNLPPCLFRDVLRGVELQQYGGATLRQDEVLDRRSDHPMEEEGAVRLEACAGCALVSMCPGLNVTLLPQADLQAHLEDCLAAIPPSSRRSTWIAGTDLLAPQSLRHVVDHAVRLGFLDVKVTTGGSGRGGAEAHRAAKAGGASEVVLVHHARDPRSGDRIICHTGNDLYLARAASQLRSLPPGERPTAGLLVDADSRGLAFLRSAAGTEALRASSLLRLRVPAPEDGTRVRVASLVRFATAVAALPDRPPRIIAHVPAPTPGEMFGRLPAAALALLGLVRFDLTSPVLPTALLLPRYSIVNWSVPDVAAGRTREPAGAPDPSPLAARSVRARPVTPEMIVDARSASPS